MKGEWFERGRRESGMMYSGMMYLIILYHHFILNKKFPHINFSNVLEQSSSVYSLCEVTNYEPPQGVRVQGTELSLYKGSC